MGERMRRYPDIFAAATGITLFPGTFNVAISASLPIQEDFRIRGATIGEPEQDLLFEQCLIGNYCGWRIRPLNLLDGSGGHGDRLLELASPMPLAPFFGSGDVAVTFPRGMTPDQR
jgi:hypothetical protein